MADHSRNVRRSLPIIGCGLFFSVIGCSSGTEPEHAPTDQEQASAERSLIPTWFVDEAAERGLNFIYQSDATPECRMPEIMGGGAALFDMAGDGDLDIVCVQGGRLSPDQRTDAPTHQLFENDGAGNFTDVTLNSGLAGLDYGMGVAAGDVDNDGDVDLYITNLGPNRLLLNDGAGRFTESPVQSIVNDQGWGTSAAFFDLENDGDLDLYVCNYLVWSEDTALECFNTMGGIDYCSPRNFLAPAIDRLYRNEGGGQFVDITESAGLLSAPGTGLGVVSCDVNDDGLTDLFVANDGMADALWVNQGDGTLLEEAMERGCALDRDGRAAAGMGVAAGDVDLDGDDDVIVCNLRNESDSLFLRNDQDRFTNATARAGLAATSRRYTRFGQGLIDFDGDGRLDLFQANGRVMRQQDEHTDDPYAEPNLLFRGLGQTFKHVPIEETESPSAALTSRGAAFGDVNGDGAPDIVVINRDGPAQLLINRSAVRAHVVVDVRTTSGRAAIGARVRVLDGDDQLVFSGTVRRAFSYLSSNDPRLYVGANGTLTPRRIDVRWPGTDSFESWAVSEGDRSITITPRGSGPAD